MNKHEHADAVVIGGGAIGTAVAYFLAKSGIKATLVERGEFPWGSSKRCDGHVATYDSEPGYFSRFCNAGLTMFPEVAKDLSVDFHFEPEGLGLLVDNEDDLEQAYKNYEGKLKEGSPVSFWDQKELRENEPNVADRVLACINFEGDAKLNPMKLAFGLAHKAQELGATLHTHTSVVGIETQENSVKAVRTTSGTIFTKNVINACGVWAPSISALVGIDVPIRPRQGQILVTERVQSLVGKNYAEFGYLAAKKGKKRLGVTPEMDNYGVAFVTEPTEAGTVLIGSSRRFVGMNAAPEIKILRCIAQRAEYFFPAYKNARVIRSYAGLRPATPDGKPIISPTKVKGFFVAAGHEGNGIGLSLITGRLISELLNNKEPLFDIAPLHLDRFSSSR